MREALMRTPLILACSIMVNPMTAATLFAKPDPDTRQFLKQAEFFLFLASSIELEGEITTPLDLDTVHLNKANMGEIIFEEQTPGRNDRDHINQDKPKSDSTLKIREKQS